MSFLKRHQNLFSNSIVYLITNILSSALPFFLLPLLTKQLMPKEFGLLGIFQGLYIGLLSLVGLGASGAIGRKSYELKGTRLGVYIFNSIIIMLGSLIVLGMLTLLLEKFILVYLDIPLSWVFYCLSLCASMFLVNVLLGQLQVNQRPKEYGFFQICHSALNLALSLLFVLFFSLGALGRVLGIFLSALICGLVAGLVLTRMRKIIPKLNKQHIRDALSFGLPLIPHELGSFFMTWFSLFVIKDLLDATSVGIYLFALQLSMVLGVCADAFNKAYVPWLFSQLNYKDLSKNKGVIQLTYLYFILMLLIAAFCFFAGPRILTLFDERYRSAGKIIGWLVLGQAFGGMYLMVTNYIFYSRKTGVLSKITLTSSIAAVFLSFLLIKSYGIVGAAITFALTRFIMFSLTWLGASRLVPMPWFDSNPR